MEKYLNLEDVGMVIIHSQEIEMIEGLKEKIKTLEPAFIDNDKKLNEKIFYSPEIVEYLEQISYPHTTIIEKLKSVSYILVANF